MAVRPRDSDDLNDVRTCSRRDHRHAMFNEYFGVILLFVDHARAFGRRFADLRAGQLNAMSALTGFSVTEPPQTGCCPPRGQQHPGGRPGSASMMSAGPAGRCVSTRAIRTTAFVGLMPHALLSHGSGKPGGPIRLIDMALPI